MGIVLLSRFFTARFCQAWHFSKFLKGRLGQFRQKVLGEISARLSHLSNFFKCISKRKEKLRNFNLRLNWRLRCPNSRVGAYAAFALAVAQKVVHIEMHFLAFTLCVTVVHTRIFFRFYLRYGNSHMYFLPLTFAFHL